MNKLPVGKLLTAETSNYQLLELARRAGLHINNVCYADQLGHVPVPTSDISNYIINLRDPPHWCAIHINKKKAYYFNSFAYMMPIPNQIIQFLKRCKCVMYFDNDKPVQLPQEGYCGEYSLDFLIRMNRGGDPTDNYERFLGHLRSTIKEVNSYKIRHLE